MGWSSGFPCYRINVLKDSTNKELNYKQLKPNKTIAKKNRLKADDPETVFLSYALNYKIDYILTGKKNNYATREYFFDSAPIPNSAQ